MHTETICRCTACSQEVAAGKLKGALKVTTLVEGVCTECASLPLINRIGTPALDIQSADTIRKCITCVVLDMCIDRKDPQMHFTVGDLKYFAENSDDYCAVDYLTNVFKLGRILAKMTATHTEDDVMPIRFIRRVGNRNEYILRPHLIRRARHILDSPQHIDPITGESYHGTW